LKFKSLLPFSLSLSLSLTSFLDFFIFGLSFCRFGGEKKGEGRKRKKIRRKKRKEKKRKEQKRKKKKKTKRSADGLQTFDWPKIFSFLFFCFVVFCFVLPCLFQVNLSNPSSLHLSHNLSVDLGA